jgi:hypothetical protein
VALPQAIQRQEAEAEAIRAAAYGLNPDEPASPQVGETPVPGPEPVAQPAPPQPAPPASLEPAAPVQAAPQPPVGPVEDATYWRQRFETLAGKYNAEMPQLHQQLREQGAQLERLSVQLTELSAPAPAPDSPAPQQDVENFGEDLVDFVRRVAREAVLAERAEVDKRFGSVVEQVEQVQHHVVKSEMDKFWDAVIGLVPDWLTIDKSPQWIQWLDSTPEYTEATYRELATQAIQKGKPDKIAKLVGEWRKAVGAPAVAQPQPPALQLVPTPPQADLSSQVAPSTVKSNGGVPVARKTLTRADYEAMYDVRNVQRYGEKEAARLIAEADLAVAEGRVQW